MHVFWIRWVKQFDKGGTHAIAASALLQIFWNPLHFVVGMASWDFETFWVCQADGLKNCFRARQVDFGWLQLFCGKLTTLVMGKLSTASLERCVVLANPSQLEAKAQCLLNLNFVSSVSMDLSKFANLSLTGYLCTGCLTTLKNPIFDKFTQL